MDDDDNRPTFDECMSGAKAALRERYRILHTYPLDDVARLATRPGGDPFEIVRDRIAEKRRAQGFSTD